VAGEPRLSSSVRVRFFFRLQRRTDNWRYTPPTPCVRVLVTGPSIGICREPRTGADQWRNHVNFGGGYQLPSDIA